jgi:hypothetical protein
MRIPCDTCDYSRRRVLLEGRSPQPLTHPGALPLPDPTSQEESSSQPLPCRNPAYEPDRLLGARRSRPADCEPAICVTWRLTASELPPTARSVVGTGSRSDFLSCSLPAAGRQRRFRRYVPPCRPAISGEDARVASRPGQPGVEPGTARCTPPAGGVIAVAGAAGSGTASAGPARAACSRRLPGRCADVAPGAAAPGLARRPGLAAAISRGMALSWA